MLGAPRALLYAGHPHPRLACRPGRQVPSGCCLPAVRGIWHAGSDPRALPGDVLIADEDNRRLLLVDPYGRIRWMFPGPGALGRGQVFGHAR